MPEFSVESPGLLPPNRNCSTSPAAAGEALALGFYCGQTEPAGPIRLAGLTLTFITPGASLRHKLRCYQEATARGRRADNTFVAPWEELLGKPLKEVRELLG